MRWNKSRCLSDVTVIKPLSHRPHFDGNIIVPLLKVRPYFSLSKVGLGRTFKLPVYLCRDQLAPWNPQVQPQEWDSAVSGSKPDFLGAKQPIPIALSFRVQRSVCLLLHPFVTIFLCCALFFFMKYHFCSWRYHSYWSCRLFISMYSMLLKTYGNVALKFI